MKKQSIKLLVVIAVAVFLGSVVALAGGDGGTQYNSMSVFVICGVIAFAINWIAFIPANIAKTEHYYDLTGSLTYLCVIGTAVALSGNLDLRAKVIAVMVVVWALRLGSFLFLRIKRDGQDDRFDDIKTHPMRFFLTWTLQGLWVLLTAACALAIITSTNQKPLELLGYLGILIWGFGFCIEIISDRQKSAFKKSPANAGKFISSGLWSWSRHPNYFGEITLWFGVALVAIPVLEGWQWLTLISPIFVYALINFVSGVSKLEQKAEDKWGSDASYQAYKARTSKLLLKPPQS